MQRRDTYWFPVIFHRFENIIYLLINYSEKKVCNFHQPQIGYRPTPFHFELNIAPGIANCFFGTCDSTTLTFFDILYSIGIVN